LLINGKEVAKKAEAILKDKVFDALNK